MEVLKFGEIPLIFFGFYISVIMVNGQTGVDISGNETLQYGVDDLKITCSPRGQFDQIISYSLWKDDVISGLRQIVTQRYVIVSATTETMWMDRDMEGRANISGIALPAGTATMTVTITRENVVCPNDTGRYLCEFGGALPSNPVDNPTIRSSPLEINITTGPTEIQPIRISARDVNGSDVTVVESGGKYVFLEGTELDLNCSGMVGSPVLPLRWCIRGTNMTEWFSPENVTSEVQSQDNECQNVMMTSFSYQVSPSDGATTIIQCETGGNGQCGSGAINESISIKSVTSLKRKGGDLQQDPVAVLSIRYALVTGQLGVQISGNSTIRYGVDDLQITCSPVGAFDQIISYSILKSNGSNTRVIVSQRFVIMTSSIQTTWPDESFQARANLSGVPLPSGSATMILTIPSDRVSCPSDIGGYLCEFGGALPSNPDETPSLQGNQLNIDVLNDPEGVDPLSVTASISGQQVPTPDTDGRYVFVEDTIVNFTCTATVGNPIQPIRWCVRRMNDSDWSELINMTSDSDVRSMDCQNSKSSTYIYNVTSADNTTHVICEVGGAEGCGSGLFNSTVTFYLAGENFTPFPPTTPQASPTGGSAETRSGSSKPREHLTVLVALFYSTLMLIKTTRA